MLRLTAFKIGFVSVLGSFMLLLGLLASTGTASAHTISNGYPLVPLRPQLSTSVVSQAGSSSLEVRVSGSGFRPGVVFLYATEGGQGVSVQPMIVHAYRNGFFSLLVRIQQPFRQPFRPAFQQLYRIHPTQIVLHATGPFGQSASQVLLVNWFPSQGFQYGLVR